MAAPASEERRPWASAPEDTGEKPVTHVDHPEARCGRTSNARHPRRRRFELDLDGTSPLDLTILTRASGDPRRAN